MAACQLTEGDIPGYSLCGRSPATLKNDEIKFWLKCRGDSLKGIKTKTALVKRVEEYIDSGREKQLVDPDLDQIYSRRKQRHDKTQDVK
ncbi:unnamed protein product [Pocillopora meandrina]|uniref:Uncharacterized protein n=1 Tax=Pocillopora meandrina TaxID=46732 RepID=A0AAU9XUF7_9CNID|nr:unnamed protein product [Pocillopora meandrina]